MPRRKTRAAAREFEMEAESQLFEAAQEISALKSEIEQAKKETTRVKDELQQQYNLELERVKADLQTSQHRTQDIIQQAEEAETKRAVEHEKEISALKAEVEKTKQQEIKVCSELQQQYREELERVRADLETSQYKMQDLIQQAGDAETKKEAEHKDEVSALKAEMEQIKQHKLNAHNELQHQYSEELEQLRADLQASQHKMQDIIQQAGDAETRREGEYKREVQLLKQRIEEAQKRAEEAEKHKESTQDSLSVLPPSTPRSTNLTSTPQSKVYAAASSSVQNMSAVANLDLTTLSNSGQQKGSSKDGLNVPLPRQSQYDGKRSWESFIKPFRGLAAACKWTEEEKRFRLLNSLKEDAAEYAFMVLSQETLSSAELLEKALEERYGERRSPNSYLAQLESKKMGLKESLSEYTADIRRLVLKGYPTADMKTRETIGLRHFIKGLTDQQMTVAVGMKNPSTLEEARAAVETFLTLRDEVGKGQARNIRAVHVAEEGAKENENYITETQFRELLANLDSRFNGLSKMVKNKVPNQVNQPHGGRQFNNQQNGGRQFNKGRYGQAGRGNQAKSDFKCFNCDEPGHYARHCTKIAMGKSEKAAESEMKPQEN